MLKISNRVCLFLTKPPLVHRYLKDLSEAFARIKVAIHPVADTSDTDEAPSMDDGNDTDTDEATTKLLPNDLVSGILFNLFLFFLLFVLFSVLFS